MRETRTQTAVCGLLLCLLLATTASAIDVQPNTDADALAAALLGSNQGLVIRSVSLQYCSAGSRFTSGAYSNESGTYGIGPGIVFSTGDVSLTGDGPGSDLSHDYAALAGASINDLLSPVTGLQFHFDCTRLDILFDLEPGWDAISIDAVFASEEYPRYQFTGFNDGLGIYVNNENIALVGGEFVNISNQEVSYRYGTGFNGVLAPNDVPLLTFTKHLGDGAQSNILTIVIGDASDGVLDTGVYLSNLRAHRVPEPSGFAALGLGIMALARCAISRRERRHRA